MGIEAKNVKSHQGDNEVHISVLDFVGKNSLKVNRKNTIELLKAMVESKTQVSLNEQALQLEDGRNLDSYEIKENSQLWMLAPCLKIFIKMSQGCISTDIKEKIWDKMGIAEDRKTLIYFGRSLYDDETLAAYNLQNNSIVHALFGCKDGSQVLKLFIHDKRMNLPFNSW
ncbi:uncharacterized protein LOC122089681 [Macadamia integrifolia]|uniref:uncharacterized protein LOC122089681 n=1 Tax=Macadamia integrifolia TaxID=60698 RepID=UPI001C4F257E|nr:uncharacterized protein LOC122089681 [Macadamia integrifolia]